MAGRNEGFASIGCLGICFLVIVAMCTDDGPGSGSARRYDPPYPSYPAPSPSTRSASQTYEAREWVYIHGTMNVRARPSREAEVVRTLARGARVQLGPRDGGGWSRVHGGAIAEEYLYRASGNVRDEPPAEPQSASPGGGARRRSGGGRELHVGPRGGCYYYTGSGRKQYVDRSECH